MTAFILIIWEQRVTVTEIQLIAFCRLERSSSHPTPASSPHALASA
jgi:hypothetical protein